MIRHILCLAMLLLIAPGALADTQAVNPEPAQDWPAISAGDLRFSLDVAGFRAAKGATYQEVYLLIPGGQLAFRSGSDGAEVAGFTVNLSVVAASGDTLHQEHLQRRTTSPGSDTELGVSSVVDVIPVTLRPGASSLSVVVSDEESGREGVIRIPFPVRQYGKKRLVLSDIALGTDLSRTTATDRFVKNGYRITPNVMGRVLETDPTLHVYFETYNLAPVSKGGRTTFSTYYSIQDTVGSEVMPLPGKRAKKPGVSSVTAESLDLKGLQPGEYILVIMVRDDLNRQTAFGRKRFSLIPTRPALGGLTLDADALTRYRDGIKYLAEEAELRDFDGRDPAGKRQFVIGFWQARDPSPGTPENEFALEHFKRMAQADKLFNEGRTKGSDTDRGRVFILYGPPSEIERSDVRAIGKNHTIWIYQTTGHYQFVFVDRRGNGRPALVHSDMPGELQNPGWFGDQWSEKYPTVPTGTPEVGEQ
jgi:GWxTD domain-containing protein